MKSNLLIPGADTCPLSAPPPSPTPHPPNHSTPEYYKNDKGEAIKKVTKVKVVNVEKKVYKVWCGARGKG